MWVNSGYAQNNDELVDLLKRNKAIGERLIEHLFRVVDRGDYFPPSHKAMAYRHFPWEHDYIHISSPFVYCNVISSLNLYSGMSFLNIGSGTGYLSTIAGLLLTQNGINHGIELNENCFKYACERLEQFMKKSMALDEFDFCEPHFIQGNCFNVIPGRQYDRVYCGAECPETHEMFIKQFVGIGGILVMPLNGCLMQYRKLDEETWSKQIMLPVSFASLIIPTQSIKPYIQLPQLNPLSLMELCRGTIRNRLIDNVLYDNGLNREFKIIPTTHTTIPSDLFLKQVQDDCTYKVYCRKKDIISNLMKEKIRHLPLPFKLKIYINHNRDL